MSPRFAKLWDFRLLPRFDTSKFFHNIELRFAASTHYWIRRLVTYNTPIQTWIEETSRGNNMSKLFLSFTMFLALCLTASADTIVYVSFSDFGDGDAINNTTLELNVGETGTGSIWIFSDDSDIDVLATGSLLTSNSSIALTGANVVNPLINNATFSTRWSSTDNGNVAATGDAITNLVGFSGTSDSSGILLSQGFSDPGPTIDDSGFDNSANTMSYQFATFTFEAVEVGTVEINPDGFLLSSDGLVDFSSNGATVIVSVPEPGAAVTIAVGLLVGGLYRRRK